MDAMHRTTNDVVADGEVVWSWRPDAGVKFARRHERLRMMGARKAGSPGRARRTPLKPLRREGRMFGQTCGNCRQLFYLLAGHGCGLHPAFPAPSSTSRAAHVTTRAQFRVAGMRAPTFTGCLKFNSHVSGLNLVAG